MQLNTAKDIECGSIIFYILKFNLVHCAERLFSSENEQLIIMLYCIWLYSISMFEKFALRQT